MPIIQQGGPVGRRGPSYGKSLYVYERDGQLVIAAWPRKPRGRKSPKQLANMERFRQAQKLIPHIAPHEMVTAIEATKDTLYLPRDLITAAMYGRTFSIAVQGQRTLVPMAFKKDVSFSLDTISVQPGGMMVRGGEFWDPLPQGLSGQVLVSRGSGAQPQWSTTGEGDPDTMLTSTKNNETETGLFALQGNFLRSSLQITVLMVWAAIDFVAGATYKPIIYRISGGDIVEILYRGSDFVPSVSAVDDWTWKLPSPVVLLPDLDYVVGVYRSDSGTTTAVKVRKGTSQIRGFPSAFLDTEVHAALNNPQIGDPVIAVGSTKMRAVHIVYAI